MEVLTHILAIVLLAFLTAGWMGVQLLARKIGTKNHFDTRTNCCGYCTDEDKESCSMRSKAGISAKKIS